MFKIWVYCLLKATHSDRTVSVKTGCGETLVKLQAGQFVFGRNTTSQEVDFIVETPQGISAVEVKIGMTIKPEMIIALLNVLTLWTDHPVYGHVVYGGNV